MRCRWKEAAHQSQYNMVAGYDVCVLLDVFYVLEKMQKATDIWSHDTLRKIGFHPYTGKDYIKKRLLTDSCTEKRIVLEDEDNFGNEKVVFLGVLLWNSLF